MAVRRVSVRPVSIRARSEPGSKRTVAVEEEPVHIAAVAVEPVQSSPAEAAGRVDHLGKLISQRQDAAGCGYGTWNAPLPMKGSCGCIVEAYPGAADVGTWLPYE